MAPRLVLADRGFYSYQLWHAARVRGAELLWRVNANVKLPVRRALADGSYLSVPLNERTRHRMRYLSDEKIGALIPTDGTPVRVVEYQIDERDPSSEIFCLITTLLDPAVAPAPELAATYHRR